LRTRIWIKREREREGRAAVNGLFSLSSGWLADASREALRDRRGGQREIGEIWIRAARFQPLSLFRG